MRKKSFNFSKLVRDKIYQALIDQGVEVTTVAVTDKASLHEHFKAKLLEEVEEVTSSTSKKVLLEELGDVLEVIHGFASALEVDFATIDNIRKTKLHKKGGFSGGMVIDYVTLPEDHAYVHYYTKQPEKYPEIAPE